MAETSTSTTGVTTLPTPQVQVDSYGRPVATGLYDPENERDACGAGIIVDLSGDQQRKTVNDALTMLERMDHRGACGCEENTGDGAGMMCSIPKTFMRRVAAEQSITLPAHGKYIVGQLFLPVSVEHQLIIKKICAETATLLKLETLGWRTVPSDNTMIGHTAKLREPTTMQMFCVANGDLTSDQLESHAYALLTISSHAMHTQQYRELFDILPHWCSVSSRTVVYKGQLLSAQLPEYYADLREADFKSNMCMVHSRFSTNTFPSWDRAQPLRSMAHNGEINTLRGNKNWMRSRQGLIKAASLNLGADIVHKLFPIMELDRSDSGTFDNVLGLLIACGREVPEAMMMMIPEAWQNHPTMSDDRRAFYEYNSALLEPWDGPALVMFSDGKFVGGALDRNGLRPGRFIETHDNHVYMSSEVGTVTVAPERVKRMGRLSPGNLFLIDLVQGKITDDLEIKQRICNQRPYRSWLTNQVVNLSDLAREDSPPLNVTKYTSADAMVPVLSMSGWTHESINMLIVPMTLNGVEPLGSMGNDSPLAVLSKTNHSVFDYFKQLFAQVTNPPLDSTREHCVMSLETMVGPEGDVTECTEAQCHRLRLPSPIATLKQMHDLKHMNYKGWTSKIVDITYPITDGPAGLKLTLDRVTKETEAAVDAGFKVLVLSDAAASKDRLSVSAALVVGAVHHFLLGCEKRTRIAIALDSGEVSQVHHVCVCLGYGVDIVCPRTSFQLIDAMKLGDTGAAKYIKGMHKGLLKIMAKMGISTLQSYKGAQIFECIGLAEDVIAKCFVGTASRLSGDTLEMLGVTAIKTHVATLARLSDGVALMNNPGDYHYRSNEGSEVHLNDPATIAKLQDAARRNSQEAYTEYARMVNDLNRKCTVRGQLRFKVVEGARIPIDEVEPVAEIVKRFCTGAMSYGSISLEAHSTLAVALNRLGGKSNTGEGGEASERLLPLADGSPNPQRSAIKQVASGRFGVTAHYLSNADEIQIKMAQGAKPGEGGELPGFKVVGKIAECRGSTPGVGLISPPPHHDIYSIEDLKQLIYDLKNANDSARISVKLVSEVGVGVIAAGVVKGKADHVLISGHDGGTGASRWSGIKHAGLPWELGLAETQQTLVMNNLRSRVVVQTDGQLKTGRDVAIAALIGAEEFGFATAPLIAMGCIMMRKCHLNTCPVGIATQDPELRKKFKGTPEHVQNFLFLLAEEVRTYMAELGFRTMKEMVGRVDMLEADPDLAAVSNLDFSKILTPATSFHPNASHIQTELQNHQLDGVLDRKLVEDCADALMDTPVAVSIESRICNTDRATGTILSHTVTKKFGANGLPDDTIHIEFAGYSGQSFGAWLCKGLTFKVVGAVNDFCGKGLCGGKLIVRVPEESTFVSQDNVICGNVALYGATSGHAFINGMVGERFCVRNSGAMAVVEGVGDHCCEYMTGGKVVVLGSFGRNFAAGMSGGIAYVYDPDHKLGKLCNTELVELGPVVEPDNVAELKSLVQQHRRYTKSKLAVTMLDTWATTVTSFVRIMPTDYRLALEREAAEKRKTNTASTTPPRSKRAKPSKPASPPVSPKATTSGGDIEDSIKIPATPARPGVVETPGKKRGFIEYSRQATTYRPAAERITDWKELTLEADDKAVVLKTQTARCMDCGVPFCHQKKSGCPLGNRIPEWNEHVFQGDHRKALDSLLATNNFPEFTGRVCPAPCEGACVLGIIEKPVTIKSIECSIIDRAFAEGWMVPKPPQVRSGKTVAIVGGGPAGLAAADQLNKAGYTVTVYERADRIGGLMMYGVPNMKCDKEHVVQRRVDLMAQEGVTFRPNTELGKDVMLDQLRNDSDAVLLCLGSTIPRDLPIPGRELKGVHFAMEYLKKNTKSLLDSKHADGNFINVKGKKVVVIGGGDTGNDCIGTSVRLGASAVVNLELMPQPPPERGDDNPWPEWPRVFRVDYGHEEVEHVHGKDPRKYEVMSKEFLNDGQGNLTGIKTVSVAWAKVNGRWKMSEVEGSEVVIEADFAFLAMGFIGPEVKALDGESKIDLNRGTILADTDSYATTEPGVFAAGDCRRGQSLVVWAIAEGRNAAASVCKYLESK